MEISKLGSCDAQPEYDDDTYEYNYCRVVRHAMCICPLRVVRWRDAFWRSGSFRCYQPVAAFLLSAHFRPTFVNPWLSKSSVILKHPTLVVVRLSLDEIGFKKSRDRCVTLAHPHTQLGADFSLASVSR